MTKIYTIGHSTRTVPELVEILKTYRLNQLVDIRSIPRSLHNPQFNKPDLAKSLRNRGIGYRHLKGLGGLRHTTKGSVNTGWRNSSFRGYADYMQTPEFATNLDKLISLAKRKRVVIMCAEAVPWRCHRSLVADALAVRKIKVEHIFSATNSKAHELTPFARIAGRNITYPAR
jgi:uncharacterized protein (DUF488 family)